MCEDNKTGQLSKNTALTMSEESSMFRSHVAVQIALLSESTFANGTDELRLHAALVLLVTPEGGEESVNAITPGAYVLLLRAFSLQILRGRTLVRLPALIAFERLVPQQRSFQSKRPAAVVAEILTRT